mgnify:CR=1 FL=1
MFRERGNRNDVHDALPVNRTYHEDHLVRGFVHRDGRAVRAETNDTEVTSELRKYSKIASRQRK